MIKRKKCRTKKNVISKLKEILHVEILLGINKDKTSNNTIKSKITRREQYAGRIDKGKGGERERLSSKSNEIKK